MNVKKLQLRALRLRNQVFNVKWESGHAINWAAPMLIGIDLAVGADLTIVQQGTVVLPPYVRLGP